MRYRGYRGYGPYRGRSRGSTALKIVIVLLAVVLLAVVGVYFVVDRFGVYSSDGFRLELPFRTGEASAPPQNSAPVVVVSTDPDTGLPGPARMEVTREVTREVLPDTTAQIFWLKNRRPDRWRDKRDLGVEAAPAENPLAGLSTQELRQLIAQGQAEGHD